MAEKPDVRRIAINKLDKFENHPFQIYQGERLEKLKESIEAIGLQNPITVRPKGDRFEILSGHNRFEAVKELGKKTIDAIVKKGISDEMMMRIVVESNLNQQSFSDWKYSQQIKVIKIYNKYIQENSQQGKRTDLAENETCVHCGHKSDAKTPGPSERQPDSKLKRLRTRDKISKQLGISPSVFERYRSIAKLDDDMLNMLCNMLDERKLGFMAAYRISQLKAGEKTTVLSLLKEKPELTIKAEDAKALYDKSKNSAEGELSREVIKETLLPSATSPLND